MMEELEDENEVGGGDDLTRVLTSPTNGHENLTAVLKMPNHKKSHTHTRAHTVV